MARKLEMFRGDYREYTATVTDTFNVASEVHFAVKTKANIPTVDLTDSDALFTVDATNTNAVNNGDGTVTYTIVIPKASTEGKTPGTYVAEIEYVNAAGRSTTFDQLEFLLKGDVNQRP